MGVARHWNLAWDTIDAELAPQGSWHRALSSSGSRSRHGWRTTQRERRRISSALASFPCASRARHNRCTAKPYPHQMVGWSSVRPPLTVRRWWRTRRLTYERWRERWLAGRRHTRPPSTTKGSRLSICRRQYFMRVGATQEIFFGLRPGRCNKPLRSCISVV